MERYLMLFILVPLAALFSGLGIYAWNRKKPMWFWSGSTVREQDITDVRAYNRANGVMWLAYSGVFWTAAILGVFYPGVAGPVLAVGCLGGIPILILVYRRILKKYKRRKDPAAQKEDPWQT